MLGNVASYIIPCELKCMWHTRKYYRWERKRRSSKSIKFFWIWREKNKLKLKNPQSNKCILGSTFVIFVQTLSKDEISANSQIMPTYMHNFVSEDKRTLHLLGCKASSIRSPFFFSATFVCQFVIFIPYSYVLCFLTHTQWRVEN